MAALSPVGLEMAAARAGLQRVPFDLSLRATLRRGRVELAADAGLLLSVLIIEGLDLPENERSVRLDVGLRLGGLVRVSSPPGSPSRWAWRPSSRPAPTTS